MISLSFSEGSAFQNLAGRHCGVYACKEEEGDNVVEVDSVSLTPVLQFNNLEPGRLGVMGLLSSPFSRLLGLASIVALYVSLTGSFLNSAALSGTAARALYLLALCIFIGAQCYLLAFRCSLCLLIMCTSVLFIRAGERSQL